MQGVKILYLPNTFSEVLSHSYVYRTRLFLASHAELEMKVTIRYVQIWLEVKWRISVEKKLSALRHYDFISNDSDFLLKLA